MPEHAPFPELRSLLFAQKPGILEEQCERVRATLAGALPGCQVTCISSHDEGLGPGRFDAVIAPGLPWLPSLLARIEGLRWLHLLSAGADAIVGSDYPWDGILVTKSAGVHGPAMSELAIGGLLYWEKQLGRFRAQQEERRWERTWLGELSGKTLVILGVGAVGACLARRAGAFDLRCLGVARTPRPVAGVERVFAPAELPAALAEADYLVVALPLTPATRGLLDAPMLGRVKPGAILVDLSRGGVVREAALVEALTSGHLRAALLDVFEREPLPPESPLWALPNVLITPHVAGTTPHYMERALEIFLANYRSLRAGGEAVTPVDLEAGY